MLTPINDASPTRPLRITFIHRPVTSAAGTVTMIVNMPQELSLRAMTTTFATPASVTMIMKSVATVVVTPEIGPSRSRAILGSDSPSRRTEASKITKSCTPPARQAPMTIQEKPGRKPHCAANTGPTSGPGPAIAAKWTPKRTSRRVGW